MKKLAMIAAVAMAALTANAGLNVNWLVGSGIVRNDGTTPLLQTGTALFQLIYSPDNAAGIANQNGTTVGDTVLRSLTADSTTADVYADFFADNYTDPTFLAGFVYLRVFDIGSTAVSTPAGTWYFTGPLVATVDLANNAIPQQADDGPLGGGPASGRYVLNAQVVPEPGTLAFLGLGAIAMVVRRMRKA